MDVTRAALVAIFLVGVSACRKDKPDAPAPAASAAPKANGLARVREFVSWARASLAKPETFTKLAKECDVRSGQKFCSANYKGKGDLFWMIDYAEAQPTAATLFAPFRGERFKCDALGQHSLVREWQSESGPKYHCRLGDGLHAIVEHFPDATGVRLFPDSYLALDPDFAAVVQGQAVSAP